MVGHACSPTRTVYVDVTLTWSPPPLSHGSQNWCLSAIVWDLDYTLS